MSISATTFSEGKAGNAYLPVAFSFQAISEATGMKICKLSDCGEKHRALGYCDKHYKQIKRHGTIVPGKRINNEVRVKEDYAEVVLYDQKGGESGVALIDKNDISLIAPYKWFFSSGKYVTAAIKGKRTMLHRFLLDESEQHIDHVNGNPADNRRNNIRTATQSQNMMNRVAKKGQLVGVRCAAGSCTYEARIKKEKKEYYLGCYKTVEEAVAARKGAEIVLFGGYSGRYRNVN